METELQTATDEEATRADDEKILELILLLHEIDLRNKRREAAQGLETVDV